MPNPLAQAFDPAVWPTFAFVSTRLGGLMLAAPLWSMTAMPRSIRAAVTVVLALLLTPLAPRVALPAEVMQLPLPMAMELVIGLAIGLTAAVLVQGAVLAGEVVSLQMGLSLGAALGGNPDLEAEGVGQFQQLLALFLYVGVGGHLLLLKGVAASLQALPPGAPLELATGGGAAASLFGTLFTSGLSIAAPVMVTMLLVNLGLATLSRAVPQLNAMMVSLPLTIGVGLVALAAAVPLVAYAIAGWMNGLPADVTRVLGAFQPGS
jgi:flagellar biosynthesis protein FliR